MVCVCAYTPLTKHPYTVSRDANAELGELLGDHFNFNLDNGPPTAHTGRGGWFMGQLVLATLIILAPLAVMYKYYVRGWSAPGGGRRVA